MNKYIAGSFAAGLVVGIIIGYLAEKRRLKKAEEMIEETEEETEAVESRPESEEERTSNYNDISKYSSEEKDTKDYSKFYPDPAEMMSPSEDAGLEKTELDEEIEEEEMLMKVGGLATDENRGEIEAEEMTRDAETKKPRLITADSFDNEYPQFDKVQLEYYAGNDCLVDPEANEEVFDEARIVGDCLDKYGFRTNDEEVIFVRNFSFGSDFEISKLWSNFMSDEED